jgi:uncharacterized lipoprotein YbaY
MKGDEMKMKKLVVLLASGALVLALASCGKKAEEPAPAPSAPAMGGTTTTAPAAPAAPAMGGTTTAAPAPAK